MFCALSVYFVSLLVYLKRHTLQSVFSICPFHDTDEINRILLVSIFSLSQILNAARSQSYIIHPLLTFDVLSTLQLHQVLGTIWKEPNTWEFLPHARPSFWLVYVKELLPKNRRRLLRQRNDETVFVPHRVRTISFLRVLRFFFVGVILPSTVFDPVVLEDDLCL